MSVQAFSASELQEANISSYYGSQVKSWHPIPNQGLPGVGIYVDGVWQGGFGFQQTNFAEMERVEVLRGPQGTLFGRNTNGGAINITTRKPADTFGSRISLGVGEFNRRDFTAAMDIQFGYFEIKNNGQKSRKRGKFWRTIPHFGWS